MFVERRLDCVSITGNRELLERLIDVAPRPSKLAPPAG